MAAQPPKKPTLPSKEGQLFRTVVRCYESRQYKKALKSADAILKKFPTHGETLAMKGLVLNCINRKEEAYDFVRRGLKSDLTSHVCWHVYGLLYRSDRNYEEAIKCYRNALRWDKDNIQILRDLGYLQIQTRDVEGYTDTYRRLLVLKPTQRTNWISFAMGSHLSGNYTKAIGIIDSYLKTAEIPTKPTYDYGELLLYKNMILEESGEFERALNHLHEIENNVVDKYFVKEKRGELLLKLNRSAEAAAQYEELLDLNIDNHKFHNGYLAAHGIGADPTQWSDQILNHFLGLYAGLKSKYPRSDAVISVPLRLLPVGEHFQRNLHEYAQRKLRKGVPSLFVDLRTLYSNKEKVRVIEQTFLEYAKNLQSHQQFGAVPTTSSEEAAATEDPDVIMWTHFYLAQHYDYLENPSQGLTYIQQVLVHTPTLIEAYLVQAEILKNSGEYTGAAAAADKGRSMDLADRYLNNECAKYQFRADQVEAAMKSLGMFTKEGEDPAVYLNDMQCMWYENAVAASHLRRGEEGKAMKKLLQIQKHFDDIVEDQLDFHAYIFRKSTFRPYIAMLRMEDHVHGHQSYVRGMKKLIKTFVALHDSPKAPHKEEEDPALAGLDPSERKKYLNKKKKEDAKKAAAELAAHASSSSKDHQNKGNTADSAKKPVDTDPEGRLLEQHENKLGEASKYLKTLRQHAPNDMGVQLISFEVAIRKNKYLMALQALNRAIAIDSTHPQVHSCKIRFFHAVSGEEVLSSLNPVVREIITSHKNTLLQGATSLSQVNQQFLQNNQHSLFHRVVAAELMVLLEPAKKADAIQVLMNVEGGKGHKALKEAQRVHQLLVKQWKDESAAEAYRVVCNKAFPLAVYFMDEKQRAARDQERQQQLQQSKPEQPDTV